MMILGQPTDPETNPLRRMLNEIDAENAVDANLDGSAPLVLDLLRGSCGSIAGVNHAVRFVLQTMDFRLQMVDFVLQMIDSAS